MFCQLQEIGAKVILPLPLHDVPRGASVKSTVVACHVTIHTDHDEIVIRYKPGNARYGVFPLVIVLKGVTIAVAMEIVDDRIGFSTGIVIGRQEDPVMTVLTQNFRLMDTIIERFLASKDKARDPE
jgi:hypothetical protein